MTMKETGGSSLYGFWFYPSQSLERLERDTVEKTMTFYDPKSFGKNG